MITVTGSRELNKILHCLLRVQTTKSACGAAVMVMNNKIISSSVVPGQPLPLVEMTGLHMDKGWQSHRNGHQTHILRGNQTLGSVFSQVWGVGAAAWGQRLNWTALVGPIQTGVLCDSVPKGFPGNFYSHRPLQTSLCKTRDLPAICCNAAKPQRNPPSRAATATGTLYTFLF